MPWAAVHHRAAEVALWETWRRPFPPYDLAPDGKRFAVMLYPDAAAEHQRDIRLTFVLNFFDELQRRVPLEGKQYPWPPGLVWERTRFSPRPHPTSTYRGAWGADAGSGS